MNSDSKISKAQQSAVHKYVKANYDRIELTVKPKGRKEEIKKHAAIVGETLNSFINRAITQTIEQDRKKKKSNDTFNKPGYNNLTSMQAIEDEQKLMYKTSVETGKPL